MMNLHHDIDSLIQECTSYTANAQHQSQKTDTVTSSRAVWWMMVGINSQLSSILAFLTELKRIQTANSSPCQSSGNHSRRLFQKTIEDLTAKSMAELLGPRSGTAWAGWTGKHKHRVFPSQQQ